MRIEMLIIDPQYDFHDIDGSALPVPGSWEDAQRLSAMLERNRGKLADIHVTLDTHQLLDIAHPMMWVDSRGKNPDPFTVITADEVRAGKWMTFNPAYQARALDYLDQLEANGRYPLCVWPPHCLIGTKGHSIVEPVLEQLQAWEQQKRTRVDFVTKGHNPWTEHYSAVQADVPDPNDPTTMLNTKLIETLEKADLVGLSGQALSHCVANSVIDIADNFGADSVSKLVLLEDTSSPVPGFEDLADDFMRKLKTRGVQTAKASEFLL